jgi:hypothetical protein
VFPIRRALDIFLHLVDELEKAISESDSFGRLEESISRVTRETAQNLLVCAFETLDERLLRQRDKTRLEMVNRKPRTLATLFGEVTFWRRYYRDKETGKGRYLLDEVLGLPARQRVSPGLRLRAVALATEVPYHRAAKILQEWVPGISPMTIWNEVQQLGAAERGWVESWRKAIFEQAQTPPGQRNVEELNVEADGVMVRVRGPRGSRRHAEVKLAVAYEGKREVAKGRRELVGRRIAAGVADGHEFWEQTVAQFGHRWDWNGVRRCWLGTDGAAWAKQGLEVLPGSRHRLDPFHLRRALLQALRPEDGSYREVCAGLESGDWERVDETLKVVERRSRGKYKERVRQLRVYLRNNWDGIVSSGVAANLGAIEGQVFHHLARRMKRHGARWSASGVDHLARVMTVRANGEAFHTNAGATKQKRTSLVAAAQGGSHERDTVMRKQRAAEKWLQVHLPALEGPHAARPWAKYVLRQLVHSPFTVA